MKAKTQTLNDCECCPHIARCVETTRQGLTTLPCDKLSASIVDNVLTGVGERARDFVLTGMLYTFYIFIALVAFFTFTGALKAWGWL